MERRATGRSGGSWPPLTLSDQNADLCLTLNTTKRVNFQNINMTLTLHRMRNSHAYFVEFFFFVTAGQERNKSSVLNETYMYFVGPPGV